MITAKFRFPTIAILLLTSFLASAQINPAVYSGLKWRLLGPFRAGRCVAAAGVPGHPSEFYFGGVAGGVWKTLDAGETWTPVFDAMPIASIGAIAVAPSDPTVVYVGSGEADMRSDISYGDGMYKSTDAGKTWTHIGLRDSRQIGRVIVDPHDPNLVFVAALGHAYGANAERGVYRSTDGGRTWTKVLGKDADTGAIDLAFDPQNSRIVYASLWRTRRPPWNVYPPANGPGGGLYKSTDGGNTWNQLTGGLPTEGLGRIGIAVAPSDANRVYALVDAKDGGLYRSDDAGAHFRLMDKETRIWQRGWYFGGVTADPKDPNTVYVANTSLYRSRDGGQTFTAIKGAPGGDDYHQLWIYPDDPNRMVLASDQGTIVSVDGAETWSSWYNQATAQFYHVAADNHFPFWVWGAQQDSGALGATTRSNFGIISFRDWVPACAGGEASYVAPDPLNPDVIFGGTVSRCNVSTGASQNVSPTLPYPGPFRQTWTLPLVFSQKDPRALYFSHQVLFKTTDGGQSWSKISDDLTREAAPAPPNLDEITATYAPGGPRRGVIYTIAPSPLVADEVWIGTDDGLIQLTRDGGKTWRNVTPPELTPWSKVGMIDASHFDANTAYAAIDRHRLEDYEPYIYVTHDGGKTWKRITSGITGSYVNVVKEDPVRKGLLYAGTELGVFVSFDDGEHWQPLQLNLPATSIRDFAIKDNSLVVATHGRAFWILDDLSPLRQATAQIAAADAYLFQPPVAYRMRAGSQNGTPLPIGTVVAQNPPDGAVIDYYLKAAAGGPVTLEILDSAGQLVRRYSSADQPPAPNPRSMDVPEAWLRVPPVLSSAAGMHQWFWDVRYAPAAGVQGGGRFGGGGGPWALPGQYTVKLTVGGQSYTQPLTVKMDPRVSVTLADLQKQSDLARKISALQSQASAAQREARQLRAKLQSTRQQASGNAAVLTALDALDRKMQEIAGTTAAPNPSSAGVAEPSSDIASLQYLGRKLSEIAGSVNNPDAVPTTTAVTAFDQVQPAITAALAKWGELKSTDLAQLNAVLRQNNLPEIQP
jgi:photosystem II stability/assembly factor-like uncharacterized protein